MFNKVAVYNNVSSFKIIITTICSIYKIILNLKAKSKIVHVKTASHVWIKFGKKNKN